MPFFDASDTPFTPSGFTTGTRLRKTAIGVLIWLAREGSIDADHLNGNAWRAADQLVQMGLARVDGLSGGKQPKHPGIYAKMGWYAYQRAGGEFEESTERVSLTPRGYEVAEECWNSHLGHTTPPPWASRDAHKQQQLSFGENRRDRHTLKEGLIGDIFAKIGDFLNGKMPREHLINRVAQLGGFRHRGFLEKLGDFLSSAPHYDTVAFLESLPYEDLEALDRAIDSMKGQAITPKRAFGAAFGEGETWGQWKRRLDEVAMGTASVADRAAGWGEVDPEVLDGDEEEEDGEVLDPSTSQRPKQMILGDKQPFADRLNKFLDDFVTSEGTRSGVGPRAAGIQQALDDRATMANAESAAQTDGLDEPTLDGDGAEPVKDDDEHVSEGYEWNEDGEEVIICPRCSTRCNMHSMRCDRCSASLYDPSFMDAHDRTNRRRHRNSVVRRARSRTR